MSKLLVMYSRGRPWRQTKLSYRMSGAELHFIVRRSRYIQGESEQRATRLLVVYWNMYPSRMTDSAGECCSIDFHKYTHSLHRQACKFTNTHAVYMLFVLLLYLGARSWVCQCSGEAIASSARHLDYGRYSHSKHFVSKQETRFLLLI